MCLGPYIGKRPRVSGVCLPSTGVSLDYEKYLFRHISSETDLLGPKDHLRRLERGFFLLLQCLWNDGRLQRRIFNGVGKLYVSLQLYCWAILWGYLWRHISYHGNEQGPQRCPLNFSFCKLSEKLIRWPTILFVGKFLKLFNFSDGKEKSYLVEFNIFKENAFYGLQKIVLDNFSLNFYIWSIIVNGTCM